DLDHVGGAAGLIEALPVGRIVGPGLLRGTAPMEAVVGAAEREGVPWSVVRPGDRWSVHGTDFTVVHAGGDDPAPNEHSVVLHLGFGEFDVLLTGDVSSPVEDRLPARLPPGTSIEVLKLAHHGSRTSTSADLLDALMPRAAVVSVGRRNRFGHPDPTVVRRLVEREIPLWRTDRLGSLRVTGHRDGSYRIEGEFGSGGVAH
ncbi:MAG: MBL fold metallo-hydrolase, partial [Longimicrobiales bacterium]|nr:MBL fold metallo-hydrolase [Longimicrobiales bacterium]